MRNEAIENVSHFREEAIKWGWLSNELMGKSLAGVFIMT